VNLSVIKKLAVAVSIAVSAVAAHAASYSFDSLSNTQSKNVNVSGDFSDTFTFTLPSTFSGVQGSYLAFDYGSDLIANFSFGTGSNTLVSGVTLSSNTSAAGIDIASYSHKFNLTGGKTYWFTLAGSATDANYTVTLAPVPEPETYALMLAGLGLLGVAARRRKSK